MCWCDEGQTRGYTPEEYAKDMQEAYEEAQKNPKCINCRFCYIEYGDYECKLELMDYDKTADDQTCERWEFGC